MENIAGLTESEKNILENLTSAWNEFVKIERYHPCEIQEFVTHIHALQQLVGMRILNREHPDIFPKK